MLKWTLKKFAQDESGAVAVDWIVLTAAVVVLAAVSIGVMQTSADGLAENTSDYITNYDFF
ncbi:MAG: hypothetical protein AB8B60_15895 [Sulfitobacter sp.]